MIFFFSPHREVLYLHISRPRGQKGDKAWKSFPYMLTLPMGEGVLLDVVGGGALFRAPGGPVLVGWIPELERGAKSSVSKSVKEKSRRGWGPLSATLAVT